MICEYDERSCPVFDVLLYVMETGIYEAQFTVLNFIIFSLTITILTVHLLHKITSHVFSSLLLLLSINIRFFFPFRKKTKNYQAAVISYHVTMYNKYHLPSTLISFHGSLLGSGLGFFFFFNLDIVLC